MPVQPAGPEAAASILTRLIPAAQWNVYAEVFSEARKRNLSFAIGGGLAFSAYTECLRNTKDMDLFILEEESEEFIQITRDLHFDEYLKVPYDPTWSYRSFRSGYILDFLWRILNNRSSVSETWIAGGWELNVRGVPVRLLPVEELIWSKLYITRSDRNDWPDILNLVYARGVEMEWERLLENLEEDRLLLGGVMSVFRWLCPGKAAEFPEFIWEPMGLLPVDDKSVDVDRKRVALLQGDVWFPWGGP